MATEPHGAAIAFQGSALTVGGRTWTLPWPIADARRLGDTICVLFDYMAFPRDERAKNLRGYDLSGRETWVAEHPTTLVADCYTNFLDASPGRLVVGNFAGYVCAIDPATGRLLEARFTK